MNLNHLDLTLPEHSYLYGFLAADGHLYRNRDASRDKGRLSVEINAEDASLLESFQTLLPCNSTISYRTRQTNFRESSASVCWSVCAQSLRNDLRQLGFPEGKKSSTISPPDAPHIPIDFWRGYLDGNGSLGFTAQGFPFISVTIASEAIYRAYCTFIAKVTARTLVINRNHRDNVYNVALTKEDAQTLVGTLYYEGCLGLSRKTTMADTILQWTRPSTMKKGSSRTSWTDEEDAYVLSHGVKDAMATLRRTRASISSRKRRVQSAD